MTERIQHVNFWWLKESASLDHIRELEAAIEELSAIPGVLEVRFGPKASTDWEGPDDTFDYGLIVSFDSLDAVRGYMPHPLHLKAIQVSEKVGERFHAFYFKA
jgi:hypothetical protein